MMALAISGLSAPARWLAMAAAFLMMTRLSTM